MALPRKEAYIPREGKVIYILQGQVELSRTTHEPIPYFKHGVGFNAEGRGSTTSYRDRTALLKLGYKDISKKHWEAKRKEYEKLMKEHTEGKGKSKDKSKPKPEPEKEPVKDEEEKEG